MAQDFQVLKERKLSVLSDINEKNKAPFRRKMKSFLGRKTLRDFVSSGSTPENWLKTFSTLKGDNNRRDLGARKKLTGQRNEKEKDWGGLNIILSLSPYKFYKLCLMVEVNIIT